MPTIPDRAPPRLFPLPEAIRRTGQTCVVFDPRVSGHTQIGRGSQQRQTRAGVDAIRAAGGERIIVVSTGSPQPGRLSVGRPDFDQGIELALSNRNEVGPAILCFYNTARMIRAEQSHGSRAPFVLASPEEVEQLLRPAADHGVTVATIEPLDLDGREIRSRDTRRGMQHGNRGGRPKIMDQIPPRIVRSIVQLHQAGCPRRDIARMVGLPEASIQSILRQ